MCWERRDELSPSKSGDTESERKGGCIYGWDFVGFSGYCMVGELGLDGWVDRRVLKWDVDGW
jgi:hypothetical protein